jgi:ATP-dependent DNA helicase RecG
MKKWVEKKINFFGFIRHEEGKTLLTVTGLLLLGKKTVLNERMPTHEVAFQVMEGTQVRVNDFYRTPLLKTFERVLEQF